MCDSPWCVYILFLRDFQIYLNVVCLLTQTFVFIAVYQLISRRRFQQIDVLEGQNILVTISGKKNKIRVYYLSWLKGKILKTEGVRNILPVVIDLFDIGIISCHVTLDWHSCQSGHEGSNTSLLTWIYSQLTNMPTCRQQRSSQ